MKTEDEARKKACHRTLCPDIWSNPKENEGECRTATTPCIASDCMAWEWSEFKHEYVRTHNLTDDQEKMAERIKSHPTERSLWKRPEGEPLPPPGEGWIPDGDMEQAHGYADGVFARNWKRRRLGRCGDCGLKRKPA